MRRGCEDRNGGGRWRCQGSGTSLCKDREKSARRGHAIERECCVSVSVEWGIRGAYDGNDVRKEIGRRDLAVIFKEVESGWGDVRGRRFPEGGPIILFRFWR